MSKKETSGRNIRIAAADIFIFLLLCLCVCGIAARIVLGSEGLFSEGERGEYLVSYLVTNVRSEYSEQFAEGIEFYLEDGSPFGQLTGGVVYTPSRVYSENMQGEYVVGYSSDGKVDVRGTALVTGMMTENGFLINEDTYLAPNMQLEISSIGITVEVLITDISKTAGQNG